MSRANLSYNVGNQIPLLEAVQVTIVPYTLEVAFPFPEFIGWCTQKYSHEEKVVLNKQGFEVLCRVENLSIQSTLDIPYSFSIVYELFEEENLIMVYRECPSEFNDLFLRTIVKRAYF
jgi:hypothetical protein